MNPPGISQEILSGYEYKNLQNNFFPEPSQQLKAAKNSTK